MIRPRKISLRPTEYIKPRPTASDWMFVHSAPITGMPNTTPKNRHTAATHALFVHTWNANDAAGPVE